MSHKTVNEKGPRRIVEEWEEGKREKNKCFFLNIFTTENKKFILVIWTEDTVLVNLFS